MTSDEHYCAFTSRQPLVHTERHVVSTKESSGAPTYTYTTEFATFKLNFRKPNSKNKRGREIFKFQLNFL